MVSALRDLVNAHLPPGYEEVMAYGMISWIVPLSRYPLTYNKQPLCYAGLAAQKNHYALYLACVYGDGEQERTLRAAAAAQGKKLDMGKSCVRFKQLEDLPLLAIGELIAGMSVDDHLAQYEASRKASQRGR